MGLVFSGCRRKERSVPCHLKESIVSFWGSLSGPRENPGCCNWGTGKSHFSLQCVSQTFGKCAALRSLCLMDADVTGFAFPCWDTGFVLSEGGSSSGVQRQPLVTVLCWELDSSCLLSLRGPITGVPEGSCCWWLGAVHHQKLQERVARYWRTRALQQEQCSPWGPGG